MFQSKVLNKIKTHFMDSVTFFLLFLFIYFVYINDAIYEIMWRNIVELDSPQVTLWHMRIACYIPKAIDAYSESIILLLHVHSGCMNVPQCYIICSLHFLLTLRLLMSYIYMEHQFLMFLDHTQQRTTIGRTPLDK
jgi:hypothetical protein